MTNKKNVVVALPGIAKRDVPFAEKCALEMEELGNVATLVEADTSDAEGFLELAKNADGVLTSWGMRFTPEVIHELKQCAIIGVGSVGVDMVDVDAATDAGIVVTNVPDIFIEEVADHTMIKWCLRGAGIRDAQFLTISPESGVKRWGLFLLVMLRVP